MTIICAIVSFVYLAINLPKLKIKNVAKKLLFNIIFILCISSFFWVPMFINSVSTRYEVYEPGKMATAESVSKSGINLKQLIITKNDGSYAFEFGPHILIMLCFTIAVFRRVAPDMKKEYIFFLIVGILSTFMTTKYFPWKFLGDKISFIQFPWRMLEISSFCFSLIISILYVFALNNFVPVTKQKLENPKNIDYGFVTGRNTDCLRRNGKKRIFAYTSL